MFGLQVLRLSHHVSTMISLIRGSLPSAMRTGATRPQERALVPRRALASVVAPGARVSTDERLWVVGVALAEHLLTWYLGMARTWLPVS